MKNQRTFPLIDRNYQTTTADATRSLTSSASATHARPFWKLSANYFRAEAMREFVSELFSFILIAGTSASALATTWLWILRLARSY